MYTHTHIYAHKTQPKIFIPKGRFFCIYTKVDLNLGGYTCLTTVKWGNFKTAQISHQGDKYTAEMTT